MEPTSQKLVHTFAALADLGQEIANTGEFNEMVRTSLHLLLGTLAIRRGAVAQCVHGKDEVEFIASWGLDDDLETNLAVTATERESFLTSGLTRLSTDGSNPRFTEFLNRHQAELQNRVIELIIPMVVRGELTGLVLLGGKPAANHSRKTIWM